MRFEEAKQALRGGWCGRNVSRDVWNMQPFRCDTPSNDGTRGGDQGTS